MTRSDRACRSVIPTRRSDSSRRAWRCSTTELVVGIQDLGGAGIVCATSETAARGGVGMDVDVTAIPLREAGMAPFEIMTSESQERMLAIITPENWDAVAALCAKWEVRATVVGHVVEPTIDDEGHSVAMLARASRDSTARFSPKYRRRSLADEAPLYDRPRRRPDDLDAVVADDPTDDEPVGSANDDVLAMLHRSGVGLSPVRLAALSSIRSSVRDATPPCLRLAGPGLPISESGIALSTDSNPRWCALDPRAGTALTVAESVANLACVGATAKAVVNCLNFGNPEHPEVMWQLSESIDGMSEACRGLGLPVIGGNVSLYNESGGHDIDPTPVVGLLGVVESLVAPPPGWSWHQGDTVVLVGAREARGLQPFPLGGTRWATHRGRRGGHVPSLRRPSLTSAFEFVAGEVSRICAGQTSDVTAVHDVGGGGLALALAEMAAVTGEGAAIDELSGHGELFSEFPGRFVMATSDVAAFSARAAGAGVPVVTLGTVGGSRLRIGSAIDLPVSDISSRRSDALEDALDKVG